MFIAWLFGLTSLISICFAVRIILRVIYRCNSFLQLQIQIISAFFPVLAIIFGVAWWTVWKQKNSAKGWGIAASLIYVLLSLWEIVFSKRPWNSFLGTLAVGLVGLIVFLWPYEKEADTDDPEPEGEKPS